MPPQVKVSKEHIKSEAFQMTKESGFEAVSARKLAERLNCSTQPIFRVYQNMEELKADLYEMGTDYMRESMERHKGKSEPAYLSLAKGYIDAARNEKNLFRLIASVDDLDISGDKEFLLKGEAINYPNMLPGAESLDDEKKGELISAIWFLVHGIATLIVSGRTEISDKEIGDLINETYFGLLSRVKGEELMQMLLIEQGSVEWV